MCEDDWPHDHGNVKGKSSKNHVNFRKNVYPIYLWCNDPLNHPPCRRTKAIWPNPHKVDVPNKALYEGFRRIHEKHGKTRGDHMVTRCSIEETLGFCIEYIQEGQVHKRKSMGW